MFDYLFLGTGASVPSRDRALPCVAVRRGADIILFDCGEGSQRQLMVSRFSFMKIRGIFVTHLHGDHFYGLPGLLQTMGMSGRTDPLLVCGPEGFSEALRSCLEVCEGEIGYPLEMRDVGPGDRVGVAGMTVEVFATEHGIASQGYVLRDGPARKIDTAKAEAVLKANNVVFHTNDVTAIEVDHKPGGLAKVLRLLQDTSVNVEYMYTLAVPCGVNPVLILRFNEPQEVRAKLRQNGVKLLDESDLGMK